jgi:hypothetical protein
MVKWWAVSHNQSVAILCACVQQLGMKQSAAEAKAKIESLQERIRDCDAKVSSAGEATEAVRAESKDVEHAHQAAIVAIQVRLCRTLCVGGVCARFPGQVIVSSCAWFIVDE